MEMEKDKIKESIRECKVKEKTADEMFEELGYEKEKIHLDIELYRSKNDYTEITFDLRDITIVVENGENEAVYFGIKELQAINKKVKELKWI